MSETEKKIWPNLKKILLILIISCFVCGIVYKAQVEWDNDAGVKYTLMATHKDNQQVVLSKDNPYIVQDFICNVPNLKKLQIEGMTENASPDSRIKVEIVGLDSGISFYEKEAGVSSFYNTKTRKKVYKLKHLPKITEGLVMRLRITLITNDDTKLILTSNNKPGTVTAFNGDTYNKTNIIYRMRYGRVSELAGLYWFICIWLTVSIIVMYILLFVRKFRCDKWFPVAALLLGCAVQWIIPVYGVPDEPWHMDTAYQLANAIMRVDKEPQEGTILKRECDIITSDLLANDVESNSYYQLWFNSMKASNDTALKRVDYVDSGNQVPDIVYLPAAIGICLGRIMGASGIMTYQIARIMSLIVFIFLAWLAIRIIPFCNELLAMVATSMIVLQQAASASYDAMINGILLLFIAVCMQLAYGGRQKYKKIYVILLLLMAVFIAVVKGGVYIPVLLLVLLIFQNKRKNNSVNKYSVKHIFAAVAGLFIVIGLALMKFYPVIIMMIEGGELKGGERYNIAYVLKHPLAILYTFWRTVIKNGEKYIRGVFGGVLGWHNIEISWIFILPIVVGLLLLINVEQERPPQKRSYKITVLGISFLTIILIMFAMLFAETKIGKATIWGIQGRYFIPVEMLLLTSLQSTMVNVSKEKAARIEWTMYIIEAVALLQVVVNYI